MNLDHMQPAATLRISMAAETDVREVLLVEQSDQRMLSQ